MSLPTEITAWQMDAPEAPLVKRTLPVPSLGPGDVLVEVAGCGLCHTDLSFLYGGVKVKKALPLTLGHECAGTVVGVGVGATLAVGAKVVVPAVLPCGECDLCRSGRGTACRKQIMPGNDLDGGFASHLVVPGRYVCAVEPGSFELWELGVVADAVSTPYQAAERAQVGPGDVAVVIGVGGIGTYGVQVCAARGAKVVAVDVDEDKLERVKAFGAAAVVSAKGLDARGVKDGVKAAVKALGLPPHAWKVFEMSGTAAGQTTAYELLTFAGTVGMIGFTMDKIQVRLGNLMAFDATLFGNWGCLPELYPPAIKLVTSGKVQIRPFSKRFPLAEINDVIARARRHEIKERPVLVP
ncbi:MAG: 6-hydroxycyclohex-1-ene-1-carbonyl-CoA dehydrogenase [Deltaproteobacteria bacterium]|nr:6-hydroxycyclohex-1-ene-1-carbonyl-CoA dehydrogenase [Deltaproteobacteria bacterium]